MNPSLATAADLAPLEALYDDAHGPELPLPERLARLYGPLRLRRPEGRPWVIANFVTSLDGVASLVEPGHEAPGEISGSNPHDRMVMGLLRAIADAVVVGAGTLRAEPDHLWTAEYIFPGLAAEYGELRARLGKPGAPLNVVVSASGDLDPGCALFHSGRVPALLATTRRGAESLRQRSMPASVEVAAVADEGPLSATALLREVGRRCPASAVLVEGGPRLLGDFFAEGRLDELFLTLAPQVAGRNGAGTRPGLVAGRTFAPEQPLWGRLVSAKRAGSYLFLRYAFRGAGSPTAPAV